MTNCAAEWADEWGNAYTQRNRVDWRARVPFWKDVIDMTGARSVYEVGTNAGWNLSAIHRAYEDVRLYGVEVNQLAHSQAVAATGAKIHGATALEILPLFDAEFDLVFTAGVLIHVPPADLDETMGGIVRASADYVLAVEYAADAEEEIKYRGQGGMLWRRDYGWLYRELGLKLVRKWDAGPAFDRCTAWMLRR